MGRRRGRYERRRRPGQDVDSLLRQQLEGLRRGRERKAALLRLACAALAAFLLTSLAAGLTVIRGDAMAPTACEGDLGLLWRLNTRYERGDIVLFRSEAAGGVLLRRVAAVPGDVVDIDGETGFVTVNGETPSAPYVRSAAYGADLACPVKLGPAEYFLLGDNREASLDSRFAVLGAVPREAILGRLVLLLRTVKRQ